MLHGMQVRTSKSMPVAWTDNPVRRSSVVSQRFSRSSGHSSYGLRKGTVCKTYALHMRIGRRQVKRRLIGLTLPTVLGTGGGGVTWTVETGDRVLAGSALQYLEDRRVLYDPISVEVPFYCMQSVREIRERFAGFIADSQSPQLRDPLRAIQAACRQFLTEIDAITDPADSRGRLQRSGIAQWQFNQAIGSLRARVGTSVAIIIETFNVGIDEHLAKIMPPQVDEADF